MKTNELIGAALDWAVAKCEGYSQCVVFGRGAVRAEGLLRTHRLGGVDMMLLRPVHDEWVKKCEGYPWSREQTIWEPSTNWAQGGPIIERENITLLRIGNDCYAVMGLKYAVTGMNPNTITRVLGPTPLIAAMRCYVASKLGDEINIPEELS